MLISFMVDNYKSFKNESTFTMAATRELQYKERLPYCKKYKLRILPLTAIYGANASGKSAFVDAIRFARNLIVHGTKPDVRINVPLFLLDPAMKGKPTKFKYTMLLDDITFEYYLSIHKGSVMEEKLTKILTTRDIILYHRKRNNDKSYYLSSQDKKINNILAFFRENPPKDNQPLITTLANNNINLFSVVFNWFKSSLIVIGPDSGFRGFHQLLIPDINSEVSSYLRSLDTGVDSLCSKEISVDVANLPKELIQDIEENLADDDYYNVSSSDGAKIIARRVNGEIRFSLVESRHLDTNQKEVDFDLSAESDGTNRLINLLPVLLMCNKHQGLTVIIDEFDRSLHTTLTRALVQNYLSSCKPESRNQLIITTHDVMLLDQNIFRRDELWVVNRNQNGESSLLALSEYKDIRADKDIRKSYLHGYLRGVPKIVYNDDCLAQVSHFRD